MIAATPTATTLGDVYGVLCGMFYILCVIAGIQIARLIAWIETRK